MKLEPTGERMVMEHYHHTPQDHLIYLMHMATYGFAMPYVQGKRVLDYGCGSGYGSWQVAQRAVHVVGVDVAPDAVAHASDHFQADNLSFEAIDPARPLPFASESFDVVLSFQVFEHVRDTQKYLAEIARVLVPGGRMILVTPDRSTRLLPFQKPWNRWHVKEYDQKSLVEEVTPFFGAVEVLTMSGRREVIELELGRCCQVKWLTLPFTWPGIPDALRVAALNTIHRIRGRAPSQAKPSANGFEFDESDLFIRPNAQPSLNVFVVAQKPHDHTV